MWYSRKGPSLLCSIPCADGLGTSTDGGIPKVVKFPILVVAGHSFGVTELYILGLEKVFFYKISQYIMSLSVATRIWNIWKYKGLVFAMMRIKKVWPFLLQSNMPRVGAVKSPRGECFGRIVWISFKTFWKKRKKLNVSFVISPLWLQEHLKRQTSKKLCPTHTF